MKRFPAWSLALVSAAALFVALLSLSGCGASPATGLPSASGVAFSGQVHGGEQPVTQSELYLYEVKMTGTATTGYGAAATSLLYGPGYVVTDATGSFSIASDYPCHSGAYVYLVALGGNPGLAVGTNNAKIGLMSALGPCASLQPNTFVTINEVTTVAAAYALAQFTNSETQVSTSSTNIIGLQNAFNTVSNLVSLNGYSLATTPAGNGTPPQAELDTLANALAACVNTDGTGTPCATLMSAAGVTGSGGTPVDTFQAVLNIAHNPTLNPTAIYNLSTANPPFQPALTAAPNDWSMAITYTGGINQSQGLAIDAVGNVWISNLYNNNVEEFTNTGALLSPITGYTAPGLYHPQRVAIDLLGNIWTPGNPPQDPNTFQITGPAVLAKFASNGTVLSGAGFQGGGYGGNSGGFGILADGANNIWVSGSSRLTEFTNAGLALSPSTGFTGGGLGNGVNSVALDQLGNVWVAGATNVSSGGVSTHVGTLSKFSATGAALSPGSGYTGGGLYYPQALAVDGSNNLWAASFYGQATGTTYYGTLAEFNNNGVALSPANGYANNGTFPDAWVTLDSKGQAFAGDGCTPLGYLCQLNVVSNNGTSLSGANGLLIPNGGFAAGVDGSGNLWMSGVTTLMEVVGIASPTVTPLVKATTTGMLGSRP